MLIGDILSVNARLYPDRNAVLDDTHSLTWSQLDARANRLAQAMYGAGARPGDRAAWLCENRCEFAEFLFATARSGIVGVFLNYRLMPEKLRAMFQNSRPVLVYVQDKYVSLVEEALTGLDCRPQLVTLGDQGDYRTLLETAPDRAPEPTLTEDDIYLILYSTGTTGTPKGMELSHRNWLACARVRLWVTRLARHEVYLVATPLFTSGSLGHLFGAAYAAVPVVTCAFSGEKFLEMIERHRVTTTFLSLAVYHIVRDTLRANPDRYDLSSLVNLAVAGGQPCMYAQVKEMLETFGISPLRSSKTYSMSEITTVGTWLLPEDLAAGLRDEATDAEKERLNSVGKAIGSTRVRVVDAEDRDLPPGKVGEIIFQSEGLMRGYLNRPDLNTTVMRGGWYHSGDIGRFDEDGYLFLVGRQDFLIKSGGFFVSAEEVEKIISAHPAVAEVGVLGVPHAQWGEMVKAVVCLKPGAELSVEDLRQYCRGQLSGFQVPKLVQFAEALPREPAFNKLARTDLARLYGQTDNQV